MPRPRVFIGSSRERLPVAHAIHKRLAGVVEATPWDVRDRTLTVSLLESLVDAATRFDFAVFVLGKDDILNFRGEHHFVPRDNVIFELGLYIGRLGPRRTFIVLEPGAKLPSDFDGIVTASIEERTDGNLHASVLAPCNEILDAIRRNACLPGRDAPDRNTTYTYRNVDELHFIEKLVALIHNSSEITFVGTGLNVIERTTVREAIVDRAKRKELTATLCFGNPFSLEVRNRLVEEQRSPHKPTVAGDGIKHRVRMMLDLARAIPNLHIKLFNNYPTMSIFRFDNSDFVSYPMGYRKLGNECPAFHASRPSIFADFLDEMIGNYLEDAVDAREVFRARDRRERTKQFVAPENVRALAIYAIPDVCTDFYRHGAELLGYDVFDPNVPDADDDARHFRQFAGNATSYGFHVTVCDLMYLEAAQIPALVYELNAIAASVRKFDFGVERIAENKFSRNSIALECSDPSGQFEHLTAEVCVRLRGAALGTNYTLDPSMRAALAPLTLRDEVMLEAYQSPFVLSRQIPHFSLATPRAPLPPADRLRALETVHKRFARYLGEEREKVHIGRLFVLTRNPEAEQWDAIVPAHTIWLS